MSALEDFVRPSDGRTLRRTIEEWREGVISDNGKYTYRTDDGEYTYTAHWLRVHFQARKCKAIILQDQSAYERLSRLDEKYQKLYVASIVHDIRTPLNGVMGMLEMLDTFTRSTEEGLYLAVAQKTCKLLLFLTYDITDYSQLEASRFKPNNAPVNIREVVAEVNQLLSFSFERKRLALYMETSDTVPPSVVIDKNRYMQILLNLESNALKFTFTGYVKVCLDLDPQNDMLITSVRDTGVGIRDEEIPQLFTFFGKLDSGAPMNPQGVGFGLAICKKLAEGLGGYISVTSRLGVGSTFTFGIKANMLSLPKPRLENGEESSENLNTSNLDPKADLQLKVREHDFTRSVLMRADVVFPRLCDLADRTAHVCSRPRSLRSASWRRLNSPVAADRCSLWMTATITSLCCRTTLSVYG